jgi:hypothetical protein
MLIIMCPDTTLLRHAQTVSGVSRGTAFVRYVLTEAENIVVDGVVASVHSTAAGSLETAPFRFVDYMWKGALQSKPIAAALFTVLESPALRKLLIASLCTFCMNESL